MLTGKLRWSLGFRAAVAVALWAAAAGRATATVIYDSGGFEAPRFNAGGNLQGQDPVPGPWLKDPGTSPGVVQTTNVAGGFQSVQITRTASATGDTRWAVLKTVTPSAAQNVVRIDVDMRVDQATFAGIPPTSTDFGPVFGLEAYDASTTPNTPKLIGSLTLDATTGDVLYQQAGTGILTETGTALSRGAYHHYELDVDFNSRTYSVAADDQLLHTEPFVNDSAVAFTDAPIGTIAATPDSVTTATGTAYFDNYVVQQVPEPGSLGCLVAAGIGLLARRRRDAAGLNRPGG